LISAGPAASSRRLRTAACRAHGGAAPPPPRALCLSVLAAGNARPSSPALGRCPFLAGVAAALPCRGITSFIEK